MRWFFSAILCLGLVLSSCKSIAPTPLLVGTLVEQNNEVVALYKDCSDGANYVPEQETCNPDLLQEKVLSTLDFSKTFISADIRQPQGYDVYLSTVMIYFRISQRNTNDYTEAERIARQFFESQKAHSGRSLTAARFYWAAIAADHAAWQWNYDRLALDADRKTELLECLAQAREALSDNGWLDGPRRMRLIQYIQVLNSIINSID